VLTRVDILDPGGRVVRRRVISNADGSVSQDTEYAYSNAGDSPTYSSAHPGTGGATRTYIEVGGMLSSIDVSGNVSYKHANAHGDIIGTSDAAGVFTERPAADEYGLDTVAPSADRLSFLGKQQRYGIGTANLIRMGVRLYDPTTGRFTSVDPIEGGNENDYVYPADPVNKYDLAGTFCVGKYCTPKKVNWRKLARGVLKNAAFQIGVTAVACGFGGVAGCAAANYGFATFNATLRIREGGLTLRTGVAGVLDFAFAGARLKTLNKFSHADISFVSKLFTSGYNVGKGSAWWLGRKFVDTQAGQ
jgi:RHS repeat-associated protein